MACTRLGIYPGEKILEPAEAKSGGVGLPADRHFDHKVFQVSRRRAIPPAPGERRPLGSGAFDADTIVAPVPFTTVCVFPSGLPRITGQRSAPIRLEDLVQLNVARLQLHDCIRPLALMISGLPVSDFILARSSSAASEDPRADVPM